MKYWLLIAALALPACAQGPAVTGPKPSTASVVSSNNSTKTEIGETRRNIKESQANLKSGNKHLEAVDNDLRKLLENQ